MISSLQRFCAILFLIATAIWGQKPAVLRGRVLDDSGAVVPGATVTATPSEGKPQSVVADASGAYSIPQLALGTYTLQASLQNLATAKSVTVEIGSNPQVVDLLVKISVTTQQLTVKDGQEAVVGIDPAANASAVVLRGEDLQALSDNPDDLQADLQALAGPSAGPNGGAIYIDGFSGGEIPPKEAIREIRINQDPFSPEYDKLGYGRIEIFTKPGAAKYRGTVDYNLGTDKWNSRNPYSAVKAPLLLNEFEGGGGGPLTKHSSFTVDAQRNLVDNGSVVNAVTLDPNNLIPASFSTVFKTLQRYTRVSPRFDYQLNDNNTLSARYGVTIGDIQGAGIGSFDLISRGHHTSFTNQTVQLIETAILGQAVNETRFQFYRNALTQTANSDLPAVQVLGSFTGGGSNLGRSADTQNSFEFQNYTSVLRDAHAWKFGIRARAQLEDSNSPLNFNGTYTFTGGTVPVLDPQYQPVAGQSQLADSIERYRRTLLFQRLGYAPGRIRELGGGASQFTISQGTPGLALNQMDFALFVGDTWRWRPNVNISYGLRYETQTNLHDWRDLAPRISVAWAPGKRGGKKTVLRVGVGAFYDRFVLANTLNAERYNGQLQQQFVITNPDTYPEVPQPGSLAGNRAGQLTQVLDQRLRAPYILQSAFTLERQLTSSTTLALTYTNSHGVHILRSRDIESVLPSRTGPVFQVESTGIYNQNQLIANVNTKASRNLTIFSFYVLNRARSDSDGVNTFPANPNDYTGEYGPAATDVRHRFTLGGSLNARWNVRLSPFIILQSGAPFNITSGNDQFRTSVFNARPSFASSPLLPGVFRTDYGLLNPNPLPGEQIVPRNYGRGPGQAVVNLRVAKTIGIGPKQMEKGESGSTAMSSGQRQSAATGGNMRALIGEPSAPRKYNLILSMSIRNLLNHTNPGPIIGNITSPLFARANQVSGNPNGEGFSENASNRRLEMQIRFTF